MDLRITALGAGCLRAPRRVFISRRRSPFAGCAALSAALAVGLCSLPARGAPPELDDAGPVDRIDRLDRQDAIEALHEPPGRAPLWVALDASLQQPAGGSPSFGALLLLGLPLDRLISPSRRAVAEGPALAPPASAAPLKPPARGDKLDAPAPPPTPAKLPPAPAGAEPPPLQIPVAVTPLAARAAVDAALRKARLLDPDARADALAYRARASSALPELRLRASRTADEGQSLSPTAYDPTRITATGGTSLWLEARATWRLDRLVFAEEEVALERLRERRAEARGKLVERVLGLLFAWQRALALADDPGASPEEHLTASLRVLETEAELDLVTAGWFTTWRAGK